MDVQDAATPSVAPANAEADLDSIVSSLLQSEPAAEQQPDDKPNEPASGDAEQAPDTVDEAEPADASDEQEPGEQDEQGEQPVYTVKVNGQELEVPLDELLKGYSRTEDYKQKTAAVAAEKRALEATVAQQFAEQMETATAAFIQLDPVLAEAQQIDLAKLAEEDPGRAYAMEKQIEARLSAIHSARAMAEQARQAAFAAEVERERAALAQSLPELKGEIDPFVSSVSEYLVQQGVPAELLANLTHHKLYVLADKARRYDDMQKAKATLPTKAQAPKPVARPMKPSGEPAAPRPTLRKPGPGASEDQRMAYILSRLETPAE